MVPNSEVNSCEVCQKEAKSRCSACGRVYYCSVQHQQEDWKKHKLACKAYKIDVDDKFGRFLVTTRAVRAGEIVLKEAPLLKGPAQLTGPVCVGCLEAVEHDKCSECARCGWPVCNAECQDSSDHLAECEFTVNRGSKISITHFLSPHPTYQCITTLRLLLLKDKSPELWEKLMKLESHCEQRRGSDQWKIDRTGIAQFIPRFFKCGDKWTEEEILKAVGIVQINGHEVPLSEPPYVAIYNEASMVEHSCSPNLTKSFSLTGDVIFWAAKDIKKGQHLSISYTDVIWGTPNRLVHLKQTKWFNCECPRCLDRTEYGTYYSAYKCSEDEGYVLPESFQSSATTEDEQWKCLKCSKVYEPAATASIRNRSSKDFEAMNKDNIDQCRQYIAHYSKWLSPNHFHLVQVKIILAQLIGSGGPEVIQSISLSDLEQKTKLCQELIALLAVISPSEARLLGSLRFEIHAALAEIGRREAEKRNSNFRAALEESLANAEECIQLLRYEPDILPEGQIAKQAKANAESLKMLLGSGIGQPSPSIM